MSAIKNGKHCFFMQNLEEAFSGFEKQFFILLREFQQVKMNLVKLKDENQELRQTIAQQNEQLAKLLHQEKLGKIAYSLEGGQNTQELNKKIDEYIQKIDDCIVFLNKQV